MTERKKVSILIITAKYICLNSKCAFGLYIDVIYIRLNMENNDIIKHPFGELQANYPKDLRLVSQISDLWEDAKNKAVYSVNAELLDANWQTGQHIVEFEPGGNAKVKYGDRVVDLCNI